MPQVFKIMTVLGARPQFVKAAVFSHAVDHWNYENKDFKFENAIVHTGQHYDADMSDSFFEQLKIPAPVANLNINKMTTLQLLGQILLQLEQQFSRLRPNAVLTFGDTDTTLAAAIAAVKARIPLIHVEAGERSFNNEMPEEINRRLTDHASTLLLCASKPAVTHLKNEGVVKNVHWVGDIMYDCFLHFSKITAERQGAPQPKDFALMTLHRAENTSDPQRLKAFIEGLGDINCEIVFPAHPRTKKIIEDMKIMEPKNLKITPPSSYFEMLNLLKTCKFVLTDSGGLQKEAYYANKRCLILRNETEWVELVEQGFARTVGLKISEIAKNQNWASTSFRPTTNILGDGKTAQRILKLVHHDLVPKN